MRVTEDRYGGITIDPETIPESIDAFREEMETLMQECHGKKLLWIKVPIERAEVIAILRDHGFEFHHSNTRDLMMLKKLITDPVIPTAKNHTIGVGAIVRDGDLLLVIKDRFMPGYKLPGGHIDPEETIVEALKREVLEETGVTIEFESIANMGHFTRSQFGESNLYLLCTAKAITKEIDIRDCDEIVEAKWMGIDEFLNREDTNPYNRKIIRTVVDNKELKMTLDDVTRLRTTSPYELFF